MKKKSTPVFSDDLLTATEAPKSVAGSPRKSTLSLIRQFARCYHFDGNSAIPQGIILN